jgi:type IV pilus assembly protein PilW
MRLKNDSKGFTLVEILVSLAVSGLVLTGIYSTYQSQQQSYILQEEMAKMQQNLRAAMFLMTRELRMAGFDPTGGANAGIVAGEWSASSLRFTKDDNSDGDVADPGEDVAYYLYPSGGIQKLGRKPPGTAPVQPVAENIEALWFVYLDENNAVTASLADIRSVEITLVARIGRITKDYTNSIPYTNKLGTKTFGPYNDGYHRSALSDRVRCRNLGL